MNILCNYQYLPLVYALTWVFPMEAGYRTHLNGVATTPNGNSDYLVVLEIQGITQISLPA